MKAAGNSNLDPRNDRSGGGLRAAARLDATAMAAAIGSASAWLLAPRRSSAARPNRFMLAWRRRMESSQATLAAAGIDTAAEPLDARLGSAVSMRGRRAGVGRAPGRDRPVAGDRGHGHRCQVLSLLRATHRSLDGLLELKAKHGFAAADVAAVETVSDSAAPRT